jgi:hypothetical protein
MTAEHTGPLRRDDALALWQEYLAHGAPASADQEEPAVEQFGDSEARHRRPGRGFRRRG